MDEDQLNTIWEFSYELAILMQRCELHNSDVAAGLVSAAVILAASDGFDPQEQEEIIAGLTADSPPDDHERLYCTASGRNRPPLDIQLGWELSHKRPLIPSLLPFSRQPSAPTILFP